MPSLDLPLHVPQIAVLLGVLGQMRNLLYWKKAPQATEYHRCYLRLLRKKDLRQKFDVLYANVINAQMDSQFEYAEQVYIEWRTILRELFPGSR